MEKSEALQVLRSDSTIRRALKVLLDECAEDMITRLSNVSIKNPDELLEFRTKLEGIRAAAAYLNSQISKPVV